MVHRTTPASSIFQLLTHPNPVVRHNEARSKTNTRGPYWYLPRRVERWKEFDDFQILKHVFDGRLLKEALHANKDLPPYPTLDEETDCIIGNENHTRDLLHKWTKTIVTAALNPVQKRFHPVIWYKGDPPQGQETSPRPLHSQPKIRNQPERKSSSAARGRKMQSLSRLRSDSGSSALIKKFSDPELVAKFVQQERFPKEYKPANKWRSEWMLELLDDSGEWDLNKASENGAWPIRQAFTYCIQNLCRYGCILTCREAFIFRVRPLDGEPSNGSKDSKELRKQLMDNGLMEYTSIPWDNHCRGKLLEHSDWTINLALWFMHILAGNNHEADWKYNPLEDEKLVVDTESARKPMKSSGTSAIRSDSEEAPDSATNASSDSDESNSNLALETSPAMKRKRLSEEDEVYHLSFSKRPAVNTRRQSWGSDD